MTLGGTLVCGDSALNTEVEGSDIERDRLLRCFTGSSGTVNNTRGDVLPLVLARPNPPSVRPNGPNGPSVRASVCASVRSSEPVSTSGPSGLKFIDEGLELGPGASVPPTPPVTDVAVIDLALENDVTLALPSTLDRICRVLSMSAGNPSGVDTGRLAVD